MKRSAPMKRGGRIKRNAKRTRAAFQRAYGGQTRAEWVQGQPSIISGDRPCVNAHAKNGGVGRKADACWIVPLTRAEHDELHRIGQKSFEAKYGIDLADQAAITDARWQAWCASLTTERIK